MAALRLAVPPAIAALAVASLAFGLEPVYDAWAWLVWGREAGALDLSTEAGPSWKPLPVIATAALAPFGDAAPDLWLVIARAGWLAAAALAWRLAARLVFAQRLATAVAEAWAPRRMRAGRLLAGAVAAGGVLLLSDPFTEWWRQFAGGLSEPLLVALVLGAVDRELSGRGGQAFALGVAAALLRPEAWPLLTVYGWWLWRRRPGLRAGLVAGAVAVPVLWIVPDLLGSGSPLTGAERAREGSGFPPWELVESVGRSLNLALAGLWVAGAYAVYDARRSGEERVVVLGAGALAWIAVVAALAFAGYAGLPRFAAPAGALACVLGGVGLVRMLAAVDGMRATPRRTRAVAAVAALCAVLAGQAAWRAASIPGDLDEAAAYSRGIDDLLTLAGRLDAEAVRECGPVRGSDFLSSSALAWRLDLPLAAVEKRLSSPPPRRGTAFLDAQTPAAARRAVAERGRSLGREGHWRAYSLGCSVALPATRD